MVRRLNTGLKKHFFCLAIIAILSTLSSAYANVVFVSGDASGVWSADSVIVTDSVWIPAGETLTIMPGVEVLFTSYYKFQVLNDAVLHAVGTESDSISFLPFTDGDKTLGLDFLNASSQSILEYCYISDALTSAVHCTNADITIRNCLFENNEAPTGSMGGGGIELISGSDPIIEYNVIRDNYSAGEGGGIYCSASSPLIKGNTIMGNIAGYHGDAAGGGIACFNGSNPQIIGNRIVDNSANPTGVFTVRHGYGGGIYISNSIGALVSSNIITGNVVDFEPQTTSDGGGIYLFNADVTLNNNVIAHNMAQGNDGGGIYMSSSSPSLNNNTIAYNMAGDFGGAIFIGSSSPEIVNAIFYFNNDSLGMEIYETNSNVSISYSDIRGSYPGIGNIDAVPMFRDAFNGDFHLQDSLICGDDFYSACIDAGSPDYIDSLIDCSFGLGTEVSDMGAYGGGELAPVGVFGDGKILPADFITARNFPNPFNASTVINYRIPSELEVTIDIYNVLGRKIETLVKGREEPGEHSVIWKADDVSSGVYFYRIQAGNHTVTKSMTILK